MMHADALIVCRRRGANSTNAGEKHRGDNAIDMRAGENGEPDGLMAPALMKRIDRRSRPPGEIPIMEKRPASIKI